MIQSCMTFLHSKQLNPLSHLLTVEMQESFIKNNQISRHKIGNMHEGVLFSIKSLRTFISVLCQHLPA